MCPGAVVRSMQRLSTAGKFIGGPRSFSSQGKESKRPFCFPSDLVGLVIRGLREPSYGFLERVRGGKTKLFLSMVQGEHLLKKTKAMFKDIARILQILTKKVWKNNFKARSDSN